MKLLAVTPKDLIPGVAFCWQRVFDTTRIVVRLEADKLVYRLGDRPGVFTQNIDSIVPVYLVCPSAKARGQLRIALNGRRLARYFGAYYEKRAERSNCRWPAATHKLKTKALNYSSLRYHYEDCIKALLAGVTHVTIKPLPRENVIDTLRSLFTVTGN
jgi:hypothetical protein